MERQKEGRKAGGGRWDRKKEWRSKGEKQRDTEGGKEERNEDCWIRKHDKYPMKSSRAISSVSCPY
jgi:hypothetical protein